ncbi:hypothetical protein [Reichenbachiella ulvae]|uniref:Uncharacterized protein n=1 Tax=Reichenbachiella ulvae TaxID=2980104 RepID=A0ABT3CZZ4_9BACT|nr:hypothetical protein [Reichenbachiella ulvae]MCV9389255.1 hypothetical protein [Reichenbachiella ulvae]
MGIKKAAAFRKQPEFMSVYSKTQTRDLWFMIPTSYQLPHRKICKSTTSSGIYAVFALK